jgi:DnaK suppressor protein
MATTTSPTTAANQSAKNTVAAARKAAPKQVEGHDGAPARKAAGASVSPKGAVVTKAADSKSPKAPAEKTSKTAAKVSGSAAKTADTPGKAARSHTAAAGSTKAAGARAGANATHAIKARKVTTDQAKTPATAKSHSTGAEASAPKAAAAAKAAEAAPAGKAAAKDHTTKDHTTNAKDSAVKYQPAKKATATKEAHATKAAPAATAPAAAHTHAPNHVPSSPRTGTGLLSSRRRDLPVKRTEGYTEERFINHQRHALDVARATYHEQAKSLRAEAEALVEEMEPGDIQFDDESGEGGTVTVDRERDLALSAQALVAVDEIDHALRKMATNTYGICENCGRLIPKARLEALPYARLCIDCKSGGLSRR